jgi:hypothetical protein
MIIYQDSLLVLDYDVSSDILYVKWPNLTETDIPDLKAAITELLNAVKHYDIKRLLIDSSKSRVDIADETYRPLVFSLVGQLKESRLRRMARVVPENTFREVHLQNYNKQMQAQNLITFETGEFQNKEQAMAWLKS